MFEFVSTIDLHHVRFLFFLGTDALSLNLTKITFTIADSDVFAYVASCRQKEQFD